MESAQRGVSRRAALGLIGSAAATAALVKGGVADAATLAVGRSGEDQADGPRGEHDVKVLINGSNPAIGDYVFPDAVDSLVLDNGLIKFTFGRDDAAGGIVTGWTNTSITAQSIIVNGVELAHNLNGVDPRDPDRQHSFYVDSGGGSARLVCTIVRVLRNTRDLVEVAFIDNTSVPLQHEHHLIMRKGKRGLYGYDILTAVAATNINEIRMNARWDRGIFDFVYNWERGSGQQPTYAYLALQTRVGDETWQVDGTNDPDLPWPENNGGNLPAGYVYTKYNWSLYHHENPMFGHYGHGFGAWLTPLGGVTEDTLAAFYGVGPNHQDLAVHQDALILNYFGANHYGLPSYHLDAGYRRLYGPWFTFVNTGAEDKPEHVIADAAATARLEIAENRAGASWMDDQLYPSVHERTTVKGRIKIADGRSAEALWVVLSTQTATDLYTVHEPTYFVKTDKYGNFSLPGIPPAWQPGTNTPGTYTMYVFASKGSITDQYMQEGVAVSGHVTDLGTITWAPTNHTTFLWQIGTASRLTQEFSLATQSPVNPEPRAFEKPGEVPGDLTFTVGQSWEPTDWYYAQETPGTWTISFNLARAYTGTVFLTGSFALSGGRPALAVNGVTDGITNGLPTQNDGGVGRQNDRSGFPRAGAASFPASMLVVGQNTITLRLTRNQGGPGYDTLLLEVDETTAPGTARLSGSAVLTDHSRRSATWRVTVRNHGAGEANDVRLDSVAWRGPSRGHNAAPPSVADRDPNKFPVPVIDSIPSQGSATVELTVDATGVPLGLGSGVVVGVTANGGRAHGSIDLPIGHH